MPAHYSPPIVRYTADRKRDERQPGKNVPKRKPVIRRMISGVVTGLLAIAGARMGAVRLTAAPRQGGGVLSSGGGPGEPWVGERGTTETVASIMARERDAAAVLGPVHPARHAFARRSIGLAQNPDAP